MIALATLLLPLLLAAAPPELPENDGWVTDLGGFLSRAEERELEELMESYKRGSGHEVALLTVRDLGGLPIEDFALQVGRSWGLGSTDFQAAALLVVAKEERRTRIEVARGLEGELTDLICGRILRDVLRPHFQTGDFDGGLRAAIEAIHAAAGGDYAPIERSAERHRRERGGSMIGGLFVLVFFILFGAARGRRSGLGWLPWLLLTSRSGHGHRHGGHFGSGGSSFGGGSFGGGSFSGFGGGGGFSGGGASGGW